MNRRDHLLIFLKEQIMERLYFDGAYAHCAVVDYSIDVKKALREHPEYEEMIC